MKLYEIAEQYRADLDALSALDLDEATVRDTLEGMQGELDDKLRAVIAYSLEVSIMAAGAAEATKRMQDRAASLERRAEWLQQYALTHMHGTGRLELATPEWCAKVAKRPPSVVIDDAGSIPDEYMRQPPTPAKQPDKAAIKEAIKAGQSVPGAHLDTTGVRLSIK